MFIEGDCADLHYWFEKWSKQKSAIEEYYVFCDKECAEVIWYESAWWFSLERCVNVNCKSMLHLSHTLNQKGSRMFDLNN